MAEPKSIRWRAYMLYMHACHAQHLLQISACCNLLKCTFSRNYLWDGEGALCAAFYIEWAAHGPQGIATLDTPQHEGGNELRTLRFFTNYRHALHQVMTSADLICRKSNFMNAGMMPYAIASLCGCCNACTAEEQHWTAGAKAKLAMQMKLLPCGRVHHKFRL